VVAVRKSAAVALCSAAGVLASEALVGFHVVGPTVGIFLAAVSAGTGWWLGLIVTGHPLLGRLLLATRSLPFPGLRSLFFTRRGAIHLD